MNHVQNAELFEFRAIICHKLHKLTNVWRHHAQSQWPSPSAASNSFRLRCNSASLRSSSDDQPCNSKKHQKHVLTKRSTQGQGHCNSPRLPSALSPLRSPTQLQPSQLRSTCPDHVTAHVITEMTSHISKVRFGSECRLWLMVLIKCSSHRSLVMFLLLFRLFTFLFATRALSFYKIPDNHCT